MSNSATRSGTSLVADDVKKDFSHFRQSNTAAEYIVAGNIGKAWTYDTMNEVFNCLKNGARLIAIRKNLFWQSEAGLQMDIGDFITPLEYGTGTQAMIIGKPGTEFFQIALADLKLPASEVLMIGDDVDSDVGAHKKRASAASWCAQVSSARDIPPPHWSHPTW